MTFFADWKQGCGNFVNELSSSRDGELGHYAVLTEGYFERGHPVDNRLKWIDHKGKRILYADCTNLNGGSLLEVLLATEKILKRQTSPIPILIDYTGSYANPAFIEQMKRISKEYNPVIEKSASVGVTGIKQLLAKAVVKFASQEKKAKYFSNLEDAKDFLAA